MKRIFLCFLGKHEFRDVLLDYSGVFSFRNITDISQCWFSELPVLSRSAYTSQALPFFTVTQLYAFTCEICPVQPQSSSVSLWATVEFINFPHPAVIHQHISGLEWLALWSHKPASLTFRLPPLPPAFQSQRATGEECESQIKVLRNQRELGFGRRCVKMCSTKVHPVLAKDTLKRYPAPEITSLSK